MGMQHLDCSFNADMMKFIGHFQGQQVLLFEETWEKIKIIFFKEQIRQKFSALLMEILRYMQVKYALEIFLRLLNCFKVLPGQSMKKTNHYKPNWGREH